jgi:hypothetical protein
MSDNFWVYTGVFLFAAFVIYTAARTPAPTSCADAIRLCASSRGWSCGEVEKFCQEKSK